MDRQTSATDFIIANTVVESPTLVPELRIHLATEIVPLWQATEAQLQETGISPPYWAFAWPGGQAIARHIFDNPGMVAGKRVLDFAAGSGLAGLAAAKAGAAAVTASDIDPLAIEAIKLNASVNAVSVTVVVEDLTRAAAQGWDVILAGDVCYEKSMSDTVWQWLRRAAADGVLVLLGDPGRNYRPARGLAEIARYEIPTSLELEDRTVRSTGVCRVLP